MNPKPHKLAFALLLPLAVAACSGADVKQSLGLGSRAPDEFRVVARPPLTVPPNFDLRPPSEGEDLANGTPASDQAKSLVLGNQPGAAPASSLPGTSYPLPDTAVAPVASSPLASNADEQFLQNVGAQKANPDIRTELHKDTQQVVKQQEDAQSGWFSSIWSKPKPKEPVVDAKGESERIKENKEEGKPVNEGDTPLKKGKDKGILGGIFSNTN